MARITLTGATQDDDTLAAGSDSNGYLINGLGGDDNLTGSIYGDSINGGAGADTMIGLAGNDIYVVDDAFDVVTEASNAGTDLVQSSIDYALGNHLENLILTGSALTGTGNALTNTIRGNGGNNTLDGGTNTSGADTLIGGAGNDTYLIRQTTDRVVEAAGAGTDEAKAYVSGYILAAHVENLTLMGSVAAGTGNQLGNTITGNSAANTMTGGGGDDIYIVDLQTAGTVQDTVIEQAGEGTDTVRLSGTSTNTTATTLTLFDNVENLDASATGSSKLNLTGNALSNTLTGNNAANTIDGGAGADLMVGGLGNDTYKVDHASDIVAELADAGSDTVQASVSYTLSSNVEKLTLTGTGSINATGNTLANTLTGNAGANVLNGGTGADTMTGGNGNDTYVVDNTSDVVEETNAAPAGGIDLVQSSVTYTLGTNLENLTLTGSAAIHGTGNDGNNTLTGNSAANSLSGGAGNDTLDGGTGSSVVDTLIGGTGNDTYIVDLVSTTAALQDTITEATGEGTDTLQLRGTYTGTNYVTVSLSGTLAELEYLDTSSTSSSKFNLTGNNATNLLKGNSAANTIDGGVGADPMQGMGGDDTYIVDDTGDVVNETITGSAGVDRVQASVTYTLSNNVEHLTLTGSTAINGTGNTLANQITGNNAANSLSGGTGNDTLDGGTNTSGADTLVGGVGNDTYHVRNAVDVVTEAAGAVANGTDTVVVYVNDYVLADNVEKLTLETGVTNGTGNALANTIDGNAVANTIDGGAGNDTMVGGAGNDTYIVAQIGDSITEKADEGTDTVEASVTYSLAARANVENLTLTGTANINGTGNTLANQLTGNSGNNTLDGGLNTSGTDTFVGSAGDDIYVVRNVGDVFTGTDAGADLVQSWALSHTLGTDIENLTLMGTAASGATGNALANTLTGNSAANTLSGMAGNDNLVGGAGNDTLDGGADNDTLDGGTGTDSMSGGAGDDTYLVDSTSDIVNEAVDAGTDLVQSSVAYTLGSDLENLILTGTSAINGTGNTIANALTGNSGANTLDGMAGNDVLVGGLGADTFRFSTALNVSTNIDVIDDFAVSEGDKISLLKTGLFTALPNTSTSALTAAQFGTVDTLIDPMTGTEGQAILYDLATGDLYYDSNGATAGGTTLFATLTGIPALSNTVFIVLV